MKLLLCLGSGVGGILLCWDCVAAALINCGLGVSSHGWKHLKEVHVSPFFWKL
jgi:hypothetical protein